MAKYDIGTLIYRILGDDSGIKKSLKDTEKQAKKTSVSFKSIIAGISVAALGSKLIGFFKDATDKASDLQESTQKFGVVFNEVFERASIAARDLAENYGLSTRAAQDMLSANANIFTQLGATQEEALKFGNTLAETGTDLASFTNFSGGAEGAINALKGAILGEREALKSLDIPILEDDLKEFASTLGKNYNAMNKLERATLSLDLIVKRAGPAIGDFARSSDSWANVQRRVTAAMEDTSAALGSELLPGLSKLGIAFEKDVKQGGVLTDVLTGVAKAGNFVLEGVALLVEKNNELAEINKYNNDEYYRTEKTLKEVKKTIDDYGVSLAKQNGLQGTQTQGMRSFNDALKSGDKDALGLADSVKVLTNELEELRFVNENVTTASFNLVSKAIADNLKQIKDSEKSKREAQSKTEKARKVWIDINKARLQADVQLATMAKDEELAINEKLELDLFSLKTNRLLDSQRKADLKVALEKKAEDDILNYKIQKANEYATMALSSAAGLFGALATLSQAQTQNRLNDIDIQLARALEAAGLEEDTAIEKAEKELELANETGDAEVIQEKENALKKAQIEAEYDKKRRKAEYEGAVTVWEFQVAQTIASGILAVQNAIAAGWLFGGPFGAAAFGATALATSGIQLAAITEAKPQPPKLASGGIIPGSSSGTTVIAGENNQAEGIFNQGQMQRLLDIADGNSGLTRVAPLSREVFYDELFRASQDGRLLIADAGVVKV